MKKECKNERKRQVAPGVVANAITVGAFETMSESGYKDATDKVCIWIMSTISVLHCIARKKGISKEAALSGYLRTLKEMGMEMMDVLDGEKDDEE